MGQFGAFSTNLYLSAVNATRRTAASHKLVGTARNCPMIWGKSLPFILQRDFVCAEVGELVMHMSNNKSKHMVVHRDKHEFIELKEGAVCAFKKSWETTLR
jgi:hypothetical protein